MWLGGSFSKAWNSFFWPSRDGRAPSGETADSQFCEKWFRAVQRSDVVVAPNFFLLLFSFFLFRTHAREVERRVLSKLQTKILRGRKAARRLVQPNLHARKF